MGSALIYLILTAAGNAFRLVMAAVVSHDATLHGYFNLGIVAILFIFSI